MINPLAIANHLKAIYHFMHIGLVQVAIKPLLKIGVNAPIYLALRDKDFVIIILHYLQLFKQIFAKDISSLIAIQILWLI